MRLWNLDHLVPEMRVLCAIWHSALCSKSESNLDGSMLTQLSWNAIPRMRFGRPDEVFLGIPEPSIREVFLGWVAGEWKSSPRIGDTSASAAPFRPQGQRQSEIFFGVHFCC
jgi:hypothetical protein